VNTGQNGRQISLTVLRHYATALSGESGLYGRDMLLNEKDGLLERKEWTVAWTPPPKLADGAVFRLRAVTYLPAFPGVFHPEKDCFLIEKRISQWLFRLAANGLSFPSRLRGSGGLAPLFLASIRW